MKISVAMCTYNGGCFLRPQLESIAAQSKPPDELVICDDGSSDGSDEVVSEFSSRAGFPVRFVRNKQNLGSTKNFEKAVSLCTGELIALCDQDDIWVIDKLARLAQVFENDASVGGVFSNADLIDANSVPVGKRLWELSKFRFDRPEDFDREAAIKLLLQHDFVTGATLMIRSSVRRFMMPIPESWVHDGWIAWILVLYSRLTFVPDPLIQYRIHPNQKLGVRPGSWWLKPMSAGASEDRKNLDNVARQFVALRDRWTACPGEDFAACLRLLEDKIAFVHVRSRFPRNFIRRAWCVLTRYRSYQHYGRGLGSIRGDFFLQPLDGARER